MSIATRLQEAIPGLITETRSVGLGAYARDLWPRHHMNVRAGQSLSGLHPQVVIWPKNTEEVAKAVAVCAKEGVKTVPYGAGSGVCGAILPDNETVVIDTKRIAVPTVIHEGEPSLEVAPGALGMNLEEELQNKGWTIGHFPSSILCSSVGGWIAGRGAGQCSGLYGKIEDMVSELELVDGRGEVLQLKRRTNGPNAIPLIVGSEGTLGVITKARLRLHKNPTTRAYAAYAFPTIEAGWTAIRAMYQAGLRPAVCRLYDPFDSFIAKKGSVKKANSKGMSDQMREHLMQGLRLPGLINKVVQGFGEELFGSCTLIVIFEGTDSSPYDDQSKARELSLGLSGKDLGEGPARKWMKHRYSVSYRLAPVIRTGAFSDTMEVAAPWSRLGDLYSNIVKALGDYVFVMAHLSHAYPDGCSIYFTFAGAGADDADCLKRYDAAWNAAMAAALEAGGTLSHHHGVGRSKAGYVPRELGKATQLLRQTMSVFDPHGLLNPGCVIPEKGRSDERPIGPKGGQSYGVDEQSLLATLPASLSLKEAEQRLESDGYELCASVTGKQGRQTVGEWLEAGAPGADDPWSDPVGQLVAGFRARVARGPLVDIRPNPRRAVGPDLYALFHGQKGRYGTLVAADLQIRPKGQGPARQLPYTGERNPALTPSEETLWERFDFRWDPTNTSSWELGDQMIGRLQGRVVDESADGHFILDVNGVGYELLAPLGTLGRVRGKQGDGPVVVHVHTHVREDALALFGFASKEDRAVFRILLGVSSVGPKLAMAILSTLPAQNLAQAVARGEVSRLVAVPGIGKKTAQRLLLELKDKLKVSSLAPAPVAKASEAASAGNPHTAELLVAALTRMGYKTPQAEKAVSKLGSALEEKPLAELIRDALQLLAK